MLTFLFALAAIWTLFWFIMLILNWDDLTSLTDSNALCPTCASSINSGSLKSSSLPAKSATSNTAARTETNKDTSAKPANDNNATKPANDSKITKPAIDSNRTKPANDSKVNKPANDIKAAKPATAASTTANSAAKKPVADKNNPGKVTPLFEKPAEADDLKIIKGIGVVMEQTLNDLGITTFKQLAGFQKAEVKMVSDALSESKAGFGDRIERDEWVDQAKDLVKKG